jgi:copper chaperone CopZ
MEETIYVDNLKCNGCASTVISKIGNIKGVDEVEVEVEESKISIKHEEGVSREEILKVLGNLGYPEQGTSNLYQKAVSYVSCATGKFNQ